MRKTNMAYKNANRLLVLLLLLASPFVVSAASNNSDWNYKKVVGSSECAECHESENETWLETKHHKGFRDFSRRKESKAIAKRMGIKHIKKSDAVCTTCHYSVGARKRVVSGVSCESCHGEAKDWLDVHNNFGGEDADVDSETPAHRKQRYKTIHEAGMVRPDNVYGLAKNCYQCHIVPQQQLVDQGKHAAGSDFDLLDRVLPKDGREGNIFHGAEDLSSSRKTVLQAVGFAVEIELSARALAHAKPSGKYADEMNSRVKTALANLKKANKSIGSADLSKVISLTSAQNIAAGNLALDGLADQLGYYSKRYVSNAVGYADGVGSLPKVKKVAKAKPTAPKKAAPAAKKPASTPKKAANSEVKATSSPEPAAAVEQVTRVIERVKIVEKVIEKVVSVEVKPEAANLISDATFIQPYLPLCATTNPWRLGRHKLDSQDLQFAANACVSVSLPAQSEARYMLFKENTAGNVERVFPATCGSKEVALSLPDSGYLPVDNNGNAAIVALGEKAGSGSFTLLAVDKRYVSSQQESDIAVLPAACAGTAQEKSYPAVAFNSALQLLTADKDRYVQAKTWAYSVK